MLRSTRPSRCTMVCRRDFPAPFSPPTCSLPKRFWLHQAPTVASLTSILGPAGPRSAAHLAAKRRPVVGANPAPMPGKATCAVKPIRSTGLRRSPWRKVSSSANDDYKDLLSLHDDLGRWYTTGCANYAGAEFPTKHTPAKLLAQGNTERIRASGKMSTPQSKQRRNHHGGSKV